MDQAAAIIELLQLRVPLDEMAMGMFLRGAPVAETAVRRSLLAMLPKLDADLVEDARADHADQAIARLLRRARRIPLLQHWAKNARGAGERAALPLASVFHEAA